MYFFSFEDVIDAKREDIDRKSNMINRDEAKATIHKESNLTSLDWTGRTVCNEERIPTPSTVTIKKKKKKGSHLKRQGPPFYDIKRSSQRKHTRS